MAFLKEEKFKINQKFSNTMNRSDKAFADTIGKVVEKVLATAFPAKVEEDPLVRRLRLRAGLGALPEPILLSNPRWLKEPSLWPLFAAHHKVVKGHLRCVFGSSGPLLLSFQPDAHSPLSSHRTCECHSIKN